MYNINKKIRLVIYLCLTFGAFFCLAFAGIYINNNITRDTAIGEHLQGYQNLTSNSSIIHEENLALKNRVIKEADILESDSAQQVIFKILDWSSQNSNFAGDRMTEQQSNYLSQQEIGV